jgi:hypothetical protein|tara:strand:- start:916 stop:1017 length:102 start_codon:yes stop_codon:yes gene_type:complete
MEDTKEADGRWNYWGLLEEEEEPIEEEDVTNDK